MSYAGIDPLTHSIPNRSLKLADRTTVRQTPDAVSSAAPLCQLQSRFPAPILGKDVPARLQ